MSNRVCSISARQLQAARLESIAKTAGGHDWIPYIDSYMAAEVAKRRANWLWYFEQKYCKPDQIFLAMMVLGLAIAAVGAYAASIALFIAGVAMTLSALVLSSGVLKVVGPALWSTVPYDKYLPHLDGPMPPEVHTFVQEARSLLPEAVAILSVLKQNERVVDPVLWIESVNYPGQRVPALVWDEHGNIVKPPH